MWGRGNLIVEWVPCHTRTGSVGAPQGWSRGVLPRPELADRLLPRVYRAVAAALFSCFFFPAVDHNLISCFRQTLELDSAGT